MKDVEAKMTKKLGSGFFGKKQPTTIAEATASLQENIDNLKHVHESRAASAEQKAKKIERLVVQKAEDEKEATGAKRLADKLENFLFGDVTA